MYRGAGRCDYTCMERGNVKDYDNARGCIVVESGCDEVAHVWICIGKERTRKEQPESSDAGPMQVEVRKCFYRRSRNAFSLEKYIELLQNHGSHRARAVHRSPSPHTVWFSSQANNISFRKNSDRPLSMLDENRI